MASNVGVNVTINNDFRSCCPRVLRIFGCCIGKPEDKKINQIAQKSFNESDSSLTDDCSQRDPVPPDDQKNV